MKMFSDCSGPCHTCHAFYCGGNCLAGHGDDFWSPATEAQLKEAIEKTEVRLAEANRERMPWRANKLQGQLKDMRELLKQKGE